MQLYLYHTYGWMVYVRFPPFQASKRAFFEGQIDAKCSDASHHIGNMQMVFHLFFPLRFHSIANWIKSSSAIALCPTGLILL